MPHLIALSHCMRIRICVCVCMCEYLNSCTPTAKRSAQDKAKERHHEENEAGEVVERSIREIKAIKIIITERRANN